ncbi:CrcB protein [Lipingzhangella halophila]|uniref:Fluoride-specific ion channel FluC n=1 Tax=Lipingzhangella halophila TaxID=1783352 RepID=A0A7W7RLP6_9ACTN|nr:CrcB family protein [Lipingzhangella halophila]MBB4934293.1 CrcB protein [Lipingzhangella halophila]
MADDTGPRPVDPDVDVRVPRQRRELAGAPWAVPIAISLGGAAGAVARHGAEVAIPYEPGTFAWATLLVNLSGSFLIGVLMVVVTDILPGSRLLRPFLGVGVLGGYTTFSMHIDDAQRMLLAGAAGPALAYLVGTAAGAVVAVWAGTRVTAAVFRTRMPAGNDPVDAP